MPTRHERMRESEVANGILTTNVARAIMDTAELDVRHDAHWEEAVKAARDFLARVNAETVK